MKKNVAGQAVGAQMVAAADGSAFTGAVTVYVTGDNGAQAVGSVGAGACTHEGNGYHSYAPAQAETNYDNVAFTFIGTGAIPTTVEIYTSFPQTGDNFARLGAPAGASVSADVAAIKAETATILADTNDLQTRLPAALVAGRIDASVGAMAANVVTAAAINAAALNGKGDWNIGKTGYALSAAGVQAIWDAAVAALTTVGSIGKRLVDFVTGDAFARLGAPAGASLSADVAAVKAQTAAIEADTQDVQTRLPAALVAGRIDASVGAMAAGVQTTASYAVGAIDATVLSLDAEQAIAAATLAAAVDGTVTVKQMLEILGAALAGKVTGGGTTTITFRDVNDTRNCIVATVDADGNRSAITLTLV